MFMLGLGRSITILHKPILKRKNMRTPSMLSRTMSEYHEEKDEVLVLLTAKWGIARSLRSLDQLDEAFEIQLALIKEYEEIVNNAQFPLR